MKRGTKKKLKELIKKIKEMPVSDQTTQLSRQEVYRKTMEAGFKRAFATPESSRVFLQRAGIYDKNGNITKEYGGSE